ncbi:hypothetical protein SUDANB15_00839 [Streptomyces sp. enrichment culture]
MHRPEAVQCASAAGPSAREEELVSVEPPSADRPIGPPSGPLSGPPGPPPSGPPSQPPSRGGDGGGGPPGPEHRPWWKSLPGLGVLAAAVAAAVLLAVVFVRPDGGAEAGGGEIFLQAANAAGPDPFTKSTARHSSPPPVTPSPTAESGSVNELRGVQGGQPGLYGGTRDASSCDVERQIDYLSEVPDKNGAFASVAGVKSSEVPSYLRSLTPLQLRVDTRVTNHGYRDGAATEYQAVLQAGTAVLVDDLGMPRVRCACGNPLTKPVEQSESRYTGKPWPGFSPSSTVVIQPAPRPVEKFVVQDPETGDWFERRPGDTGKKDRATPPPDDPTPWDGPAERTASSSPDTEPRDGSTTDGSTTDGSTTDGSTTDGSTTDGPANSDSPGSDSPRTDSPGSDSPGSDSPRPDSPGYGSPGSDSPGSDSPRPDSPGYDSPGPGSPEPPPPGSGSQPQPRSELSPAS